MQIQSTDAFGPTIFRPRGTLDLIATAHLLTVVKECQARSPRCVVVDLSQVIELERGVARILLLLQQHLAQRQCRLVLLDASPTTRQSLEAARGYVAA